MPHAIQSVENTLHQTPSEPSDPFGDHLGLGLLGYITGERVASSFLAGRAAWAALAALGSTPAIEWAPIATSTLALALDGGDLVGNDLLGSGGSRRAGR